MDDSWRLTEQSKKNVGALPKPREPTFANRHISSELFTMLSLPNHGGQVLTLVELPMVQIGDVALAVIFKSLRLLQSA